jgi:hypothetical protein
MNKLMAFSLLCAAFTGVPAPAQTQDTTALEKDTVRYGSIEGIVLSTECKEPLPGARVTPQGFGDVLYTSIEGTFKLDNIVPGHYRLRVYMPGFYGILSDEFVIKSELVTKVEIILKPIVADDNLRGSPRPMVYSHQTGTVRVWTESEIRKLPGH